MLRPGATISSKICLILDYLGRDGAARRVLARSGDLADHSSEAALCRASQIATHSPSDNTNITIEEAALLSRVSGARAPSDRTNGGSWARQAPSNKIRRCASLPVFWGTILD